VLDPGGFSALVKALETANHGRTRTMPRLLVGNHQAAELNSVLQTPFVSTNASNTVATTSFGGTQDAGTQISVTPQIAEGDQILLDYTISLSSFVGSPSNPNFPPPETREQAQEHGHRAGWVHGRGGGARDPERERRPHQDAAAR
jgi:type II secretory pathway component GspD/PulD (secretin)